LNGRCRCVHLFASMLKRLASIWKIQFSLKTWISQSNYLVDYTLLRLHFTEWNIFSVPIYIFTLKERMTWVSFNQIVLDLWVVLLKLFKLFRLNEVAGWNRRSLHWFTLKIPECSQNHIFSFRNWKIPLVHILFF